MPHPWIWLNEPQHSAAIQAITGVVAGAAAIAAGWFAYRAYHAATQQIVHAKAAAEHARTQADAAQKQLKLAIMEHSEEKAQRRNEEIRRDLALRDEIHRARTRDDAYAPRLGIMVYSQGNQTSLQLHNRGVGDALAVKITHPGLNLPRNLSLLSGGTVAYLELVMAYDPATTFRVEYKTDYGTVRVAILSRDVADVISTEWPTEVPDMIAKYGLDI